MKPGFKQTEVGVIPEDWEVKPCTAISTHITVGIVIRPKQYYVSHGVPALRSANIREDGINDNDMVFISDHANTLLSKSMVRPGDVLTVRTGYPGTTAVVPERHAGSNCIDLLITRPSQSVIPTFLARWINSPFGKEQVLRNKGGLAQQHFNVSDLRILLVAIPALAEQRAIAEALGDADALIESLERLVAKKRDLKQGAMQELLTARRRLPGFTGKWETTRFGQLGRCIRGVGYNPDIDLSPCDMPSSIRLLRANNVQDASIVFSDFQYVNARRVSSEQRLKPKDVLICMANGSKELVGKAGQFAGGQGYDYTFGAFMGCFRPDVSAADPDFSFFMFQTEAYRKHIAVLLAGTSINNLNPGNVENFEMPMPRDRSEQTAIAAVLSDMDAEIAALEAKLAKARAIKQGMMQELLTGRIRLK